MAIEEVITALVFDLSKAGIDEKQIEIFIANNRMFSGYVRVMSGVFFVRHTEDGGKVVDMISTFIPNKKGDFLALGLREEGGLNGFLPNAAWDALNEKLDIVTKDWTEES